ncbi:uncharacterized protein LOC129984641 [Argiope bruennichi]|uniref:uncharacterized protein LOC129984641 n=1 Tax=Argiope bruennichi TaxID=94029 RepID=UPI00249482F3|nr:uncharacterized protein LOC129984641 [Argiope bruennichi]
MSPKRNVLLLVALVAIFGCAKTASPHHPHSRVRSNSFKNDALEREFELIESGDDAIEEPAPEINNEKATGCQAASKKNTDEYIDKVLEETRPKIPEPAFLPERMGRFKLFNGTLENLSNLKRVGPALVRCTESSVSFLVPVGLNNLTGRYFWEMDTTGLPIFRGFIDMFIGKVEADVLYTRQRIPDESGTKKAIIEKFQINKLEGIKVDFDGLGPINRIASRLTNLAARFFNRGLSRALEGPVRNAINKELKNIKKYEKYYF